MTACIKHWFKKNRWILLLSILLASASVFFGGGNLAAAAVYTIIIEICAFRFLWVKDSKNRDDAGETVEILGVRRKSYFLSYISITLLLTVIYSGVFTFCTYLGSYFGFSLKILPPAVDKHQSIYSDLFLYALVLCLVITDLCIMSTLVNGNNIVKRAMIVISTVYCTIIVYVLYLLLLILAQLSANEQKIQMYAAAGGGAALLIMLAVYILVSIRTAKKFLNNNIQPEVKIDNKITGGNITK
ncbi:MAG TPA: hypothetical protein VHO66_09970 [Ruminiclostridium sp.]|nr:hypothetical protein [Ruminiclostridium sp.]